MRAPRSRGLDLLVAIGVLGVLAMAPVAHLVAGAEPASPDDRPAFGVDEAAPQVRRIPVGIEDEPQLDRLADAPRWRPMRSAPPAGPSCWIWSAMTVVPIAPATDYRICRTPRIRVHEWAS